MCVAESLKRKRFGEFEFEYFGGSDAANKLKNEMQACKDFGPILMAQLFSLLATVWFIHTGLCVETFQP